MDVNSKIIFGSLAVSTIYGSFTYDAYQKQKSALDLNAMDQRCAAIYNANAHMFWSNKPPAFITLAQFTKPYLDHTADYHYEIAVKAQKNVFTRLADYVANQTVNKEDAVFTAEMYTCADLTSRIHTCAQEEDISWTKGAVLMGSVGGHRNVQPVATKVQQMATARMRDCIHGSFVEIDQNILYLLTGIFALSTVVFLSATSWYLGKKAMVCLRGGKAHTSI